MTVFYCEETSVTKTRKPQKTNQEPNLLDTQMREYVDVNNKLHRSKK